MAKKKGKKVYSAKILDLNNNGIIGDSEDKSIAGTILSMKKEDIEDKSIAGTIPSMKKEDIEVKPKPLDGKFTMKDINLTYRRGDLVPQSQIEQWKSQGINYAVWFD